MKQGRAASLSSYTTGSPKPSFIFVDRNRDPVPADRGGRHQKMLPRAPPLRRIRFPNCGYPMNI
jgi:hypothetical protein